MGKQDNFSSGDTLPSAFINTLQEIQTDTMWSLRLVEGPSADKITTNLSGGNPLSASLTIDNGAGDWYPAYQTASKTSGAASGGSGTRYLYATTDSGTYPDFSLEIASANPGGFARQIGEATWDGATLSQVKLTNGVHANAYQWNSFVFRTVKNQAGDIALTLRGGQSQNTAASKLLSIGYDNGSSVYQEKFHVSGIGRITSVMAAVSDVHYTTRVSGDSFARMSLEGNTISLGPGSSALDTEIERTASGVVQVTDTVDVAFIQNSTGLGAGMTGGLAGAVNIDDDVNLATGAVYRVAGSQISTSNLSNASNISLKDTAATISGTRTHTGTISFSNSMTGTGASGVYNRSGAASTNEAFASLVSGDANDRFNMLVSGKMAWGGGTGATDVTLERSAASTLLVTGTLQATAAASAGNDVVNKTYADATYVALTGTQTISGLKTLSAGLTVSGATALQRTTSASGDTGLGVRVTGDTFDRVQILGSGAIQWGSGSGALDTGLSRTGAGVLSLDAGDQLRVQQDPSNGNDVARKDYVDTKAPIASPTLTGTPRSVTPTAGDNSTKIATTAFVSTAATNVDKHYIGEYVFMSDDTSTPSKCVPADGAAISRTTYADYFALVGTTYGAGDGSTTFNVPDAGGRILVGKGTHVDVNDLTDNDGLSLANRTPSHTHDGGSYAAASHTHGAGSFTASAHTHAAGTYGVDSHSHGHTLTLPSHRHTGSSLNVTVATHPYDGTAKSGTGTSFTFTGGHNHTASVSGQTGYESGQTINGSISGATATISGSSASSSPAVTGTSDATAPAVSGSSGSETIPYYVGAVYIYVGV